MHTIVGAALIPLLVATPSIQAMQEAQYQHALVVEATDTTVRGMTTLLLTRPPLGHSWEPTIEPGSAVMLLSGPSDLTSPRDSALPVATTPASAGGTVFIVVLVVVAVLALAAVLLDLGPDDQPPDRPPEGS